MYNVNRYFIGEFQGVASRHRKYERAVKAAEALNKGMSYGWFADVTIEPKR